MSSSENNGQSSEISDLERRHRHHELSDAEVVAFFNYQLTHDERAKNIPYARLVAAMYIFVPYLEERPQLIPAFVRAAYAAGNAVFAGVSSREGFLEFLDSKAQVDDQLKAALQKHRPLFEEALEQLKPPINTDEHR